MTATRKPGTPNWPRLLTAADLAEMPTSLPGGDVKYELDDGVLVVMAPPGGDHGRKQNKVCTLLTNEAEAKGLGHAYGEVGIVLRRGPDRVPGADAAFLTTDQLPARYSREGYLETIPKLIVEIRSKNDTPTEIETKAASTSRRVWSKSGCSTPTRKRSRSTPRLGFQRCRLVNR